MKADRRSGREQITFSDAPLGDAAAEVWPGVEGQFGLAFAHAPIGMAIFGLDYRLRRANRALCEMLGYSQRELLERTLTDLTHPDDRERDGALLRRLLRGEIPGYRLERRCIARDGSEAWLNLSALLVRDNQGAPSYGMAMAEDVTERRRA